MTNGVPVFVYTTAPQAYDALRLQKAHALLDRAEQARAQRFSSAQHRHDFVVAHALKRMALSGRSGLQPTTLRFEMGPHGRPELAPSYALAPPLRFSLSYTRGLVGCAVARGTSLGFDVQLRDSDAPASSAERFFCGEERRWLRAQSASSPLGFHALWTLKEAYLKALGGELTSGLASCWIEPHSNGTALLRRPASPISEADWTLRWWADQAHSFAFAAQGDAQVDVLHIDDVTAWPQQLPLAAH